MSKHNKSPLTLTYISIRKIIGVLAMALPIVIFLAEKVFFHVDLQTSISAYYYTEMRWFFTLTLCSIGFFLLFYQGYDDLDKWLARIAGIAAFSTAFFPTTPTNLEISYSPTAATIHKISAATMFIIVAFFSYYRFTKGEEPLSEEKDKRNYIYKICGVAIVIAIVAMGLSSVWQDQFAYTIYWGEFVALFFFGISWAVKGEMLWKDAVPSGNSERFNKLQSRQFDGYKSGMGVFIFLIAIWFTVLLFAAEVAPFSLFAEGNAGDSEVATSAVASTLGFYKTEAREILMGILFALVVVVFYFILNYQVLSLFWPLVRRNFRVDLGDDESGEKEELWTLFSNQINELGVHPRFSVNPRADTGISAPSTLVPEKSYLKTFFDILNWIFPRLGYTLRMNKMSSKKLGAGLSLTIMKNDRKENIAGTILWASTFRVNEEQGIDQECDLNVYRLLMIPAYFWFADMVDRMDGFETDEQAGEAKVNYYLGLILWHKDLDQGISLFSRSISHKPNYWPAYAALGRLWTEKSQAVQLEKKDELASEYLLLANSYLAIAVHELKNQGSPGYIYFSAFYNQIVAWKYLTKLKGETDDLSDKFVLNKGKELKKEALEALSKVSKEDLWKKKWLTRFLPTLEFVLQNLEIKTKYSNDIKGGLEKALEQLIGLQDFEPPINMDQPMELISEGGRHFMRSHYRVQYNAACFYSQLASMTSKDEKSTYVDLALDHLNMALSTGGSLVNFAKTDSSLESINTEDRFKRITKSDKQTKKTKEMEESKLHIIHYPGKEQKDDSIDLLPGITEKLLLKFADLNITTRNDLLLNGINANSRYAIAKKTKVDKKLLTWWLNLCDLIRVPGLTMEAAIILEQRGGVDTIKELRRRDANKLYTALDGIYTKEILQTWIAASAELIPSLEYD